MTLGRLRGETGRGAQEGAPRQPQDIPNPPAQWSWFLGSWGPGSWVLGPSVLGPGSSALGSCVLGPGLVSWVLCSWAWALLSRLLTLLAPLLRPPNSGWTCLCMIQTEGGPYLSLLLFGVVVWPEARAIQHRPITEKARNGPDPATILRKVNPRAAIWQSK